MLPIITMLTLLSTNVFRVANVDSNATDTNFRMYILLSLLSLLLYTHIRKKYKNR